jgi:hypothetical protein
LAYFDQYIYWTEFQKGTVHRKKLNTEEDTPDILSEEFSSLFEIRVFDNTSQTGELMLEPQNFLLRSMPLLICFNTCAPKQFDASLSAQTIAFPALHTELYNLN